MKQKLGEFIWGRDPRYGHAFDYVMIVLIVISISLMAVETLPQFPVDWKGPILGFDWVIVVIFTVEYGCVIGRPRKSYAMSSASGD